MEQADGKHPCPVCGKTIFEEYDSYDVCEFCGWEDNAYQEEHPYTGGGPNSSLYSYRKKYRQKIVADPDYTWAKECDEQREKKGIFWIVDRKNLQNNEPYLFRIPVDYAGAPCFLTPIPPSIPKTAITTRIKRRGIGMFPRNFAAASPIIIVRAAGWRSKRKEKQKYFSIQI